MRNIKIISLLGFMLFALAPLALADYHYASHGGSNTYPYTSWETAADSIGPAMRAADPYDTIFIAAGEYNETMNMGEGDSCLTFIGAGIDSTHCFTDNMAAIWYVANRTSANHISYSQAHNHLCLSMRTVGTTVIARNCSFEGYRAILGGGDSVVAENCQFINEIGAIDAFGGVRKLVFRNNYFKTNVTPYVFLTVFSNAIIENNLILADRSQLNGIIFSSYGPMDTIIFNNNYVENFTHGPPIYYPLYCQAINNTARRFNQGPLPRYNVFDVLFGRPGGSVVFINNSISDAGYGIQSDLESLPQHLSINYNSFWNNVWGDLDIRRWDFTDTIGNFNAYPMFANPDSFDVHLQAYSPLIDAGDPNILDIDGTRSDIGVFGGPRGSSHEYQDMPPKKPDSLAYQLRPDTIIVRWRLNHEADFNRYIVWRDTVPGFTPWAGNILFEPDTNLIYDTNWNDSHNYYYRVAAYDNQWNLSEISNELVVLISGVDNDNLGVETPRFTAIESNYPNPFNSSTTIVFAVADLGPIPAQINIDIYDIQGRKIRSLLDNRLEVGKHTITWDGKDDSGHELSSGIYFARITQWHVDYLSRNQKLMLVR